MSYISVITVIMMDHIYSVTLELYMNASIIALHYGKNKKLPQHLIGHNIYHVDS